MFDLTYKEIVTPTVESVKDRVIFLMLKNRRLAIDGDFNTGFEIIFERQPWLHSLYELTAAFWEFQH